jgi:hypothetical protein
LFALLLSGLLLAPFARSAESTDKRVGGSSSLLDEHPTALALAALGVRSTLDTDRLRGRVWHQTALAHISASPGVSHHPACPQVVDSRRSTGASATSDAVGPRAPPSFLT